MKEWALKHWFLTFLLIGGTVDAVRRTVTAASVGTDPQDAALNKYLGG